ncbi:MAG: caspase family protein [Myxococcaceae bacterium]
MNRLVALTLLVASALPLSAFADQPTLALRRFALLIGTNDGGDGRVRLRYAVSDAQNFGEVLQELGGVEQSDTVLLQEAGRADVQKGLVELRRRLERARAQGTRTEAIIYYSGHSDEEGLLLQDERFAFSEFRTAIEALPADVRVAILDSCASGALARRKGGARRPAFLMDVSSDVRGQAILTSSAADEASQESDRIGASYFTHHLVSGLRGAADRSRDGKVTLNEAYEFAFRETLARTERSQAGAQHPGYEIDLAGSGELVLTDLRVTRAGLRIAKEIDGRLFVRDAEERLVLELRKSKGEELEVGLAEGVYSVIRERDGGRWQAQVTVPPGSRTMVTGGQFSAVAWEPTVRRGGPEQAHRFVNVALTPYLSTNDVVAGFGGSVANNVSFGLIGARSAGVKGLGLGAAFHWIEKDLSGLQLAGALNVTGGASIGAQVAGALNIAGRLEGVQVAGGLNITSAEMRGLQLAGGLNITGAQMRGIQIAGGFNSAGTLVGLQGAPINFAGAGNGAQLGVINIGGDIDGAQIGIINIGTKVRGLQLGIINVGGEVDGESIGIFSLVRNGQFHAEVWGSDVSLANVGVKFGSRRFYTLFAAGLRPNAEKERWSLGLGFGVHLPIERWFVDVDVVQHSLFKAGESSSTAGLSQLRAQVGFQLLERFAVFGGPTLNVSYDYVGADAPELSGMPTGAWGSTRVWPGFLLGVRI